jgi:hypothetical protein
MYALENNLSNEQAGFCIDQIRIIIEQSVESQSLLYMVFLDYKRAFDPLNRNVSGKN